MKQITSEYATDALRRHRANGNHVDDPLFLETERAESLFVLHIEDHLAFYSLIWHQIDPSRLLTPRGKSRTIEDVANRLQQYDYQFSRLAHPMNLPANEHDPTWFQTCAKIDAEFDWANFGWISMVLPNDIERKQSPKGTFYIRDGAHKSLVLAKRLISREIEFRPLEALFLVPRRI